MKLLLFDIDGTLVKTYGSGRRAVEESLSTAFQHPVSTQGIDFGGKTDRQIFREVLLANGLPDSSENIETAASVYTQALYTALPEGRFEVLKGVFPLLEALQKRDDVTLSLLTGNIEEMAWLKLRHGGLDHYFEFGAFGSDSEHRNELPHYAFKKAQKRGQKCLF